MAFVVRVSVPVPIGNLTVWPISQFDNPGIESIALGTVPLPSYMKSIRAGREDSNLIIQERVRLLIERLAPQFARFGMVSIHLQEIRQHESSSIQNLPIVPIRMEFVQLTRNLGFERSKQVEILSSAFLRLAKLSGIAQQLDHFILADPEPVELVVV